MLPLGTKILWTIASIGTSLLIGTYLLQVGGILQIIDAASAHPVSIRGIVLGYLRFNASFLVQIEAAMWVYLAWPELARWAEKRFAVKQTSSKSS